MVILQFNRGFVAPRENIAEGQPHEGAGYGPIINIAEPLDTFILDVGAATALTQNRAGFDARPG